MTAGETRVGHGYDATDTPDTPRSGHSTTTIFDYGSLPYRVLAIDVATNVVRFAVEPGGQLADETLTLEFGGHALAFSDRISVISFGLNLYWLVPAALGRQVRKVFVFAKYGKPEIAPTEETLYEEQLLPVCRPALLAARGRPRGRPTWRIGRCSTTWAGTPTGRTGSPARACPRRTCRGPRLPALQHGGAGRGARHRRRRRPPDADRAGAGHPTLVPLFARQAEAPERCCLITTAAARQRPEVQAFRAWVVREAAHAGPAEAGPSPS